MSCCSKAYCSVTRHSECIHSASLYEGWLLCRDSSYTEEGKRVIFCGLRLYIDYRAYEPEYATFPFSLDQIWLEKYVFDRRLNDPHTPRQGRQDIVLISAKLPTNAYDSLQRLLKERNRAATVPYHWIVGAIIPVPGGNLSAWMQLPYSAWDKNIKSTDTHVRWLIVLSGGTPSPSMDDLPHRHGDPWRSCGVPKVIEVRRRHLIKDNISERSGRSRDSSMSFSSIEEREHGKWRAHNIRRSRSRRADVPRTDILLPRPEEEYELLTRKRESNLGYERKEKDEKADGESPDGDSEEHYLYTEEEAKKMMDDFLKIFADKDVETDASAAKEQNPV